MKDTVKKQKTRRNRNKYPALEPKLNLKTRTELIDYDYLSQLSPEEKEWLNGFTEEYTNANLKHKGKKLHKSKRLKKDCYDRNNSRNRCILTRANASNRSIIMSEIHDTKEVDETIEEKIIKKIDDAT